MARTPAAAEPWRPPSWQPADASALQALLRGAATPEQQKRALDWIVNAACATYDLSFRPDSERATAFAEGRRFVGLEIVKLTKLDLARMRGRDHG
jgi:hypothetical protein